MSVNGSNVLQPNYCDITDSNVFVFVAYSIMSLLFLSPVFLLVLYLGLQRWRQQRSASADGTLTNSDVFTLHLAVIELFGIFGSTVVSIGILKKDKTLVTVGSWPFNMTWYGETAFHVLTTMECYLAVVYPIRYQSLRRERRITLRNVSIACAWLMSFVEVAMSLSDFFMIIDFILFILNFFIATYCSVVVLYILGKKLREQSGKKDQVCQRKRKAYCIVRAMLLMLLLRFVINIIWIGTEPTNQTEICMAAIYQTWLTLPSRLALPLRFLHRSGIFSYCKSDE